MLLLLLLLRLVIWYLTHHMQYANVGPGSLEGGGVPAVIPNGTTWGTYYCSDVGSLFGTKNDHLFC